jgi:curved DNA-binding protein CbpA
VPVTSDCYAILGVTPAAEDVVIGAAYRALMRHYHPDTNPDPEAQTRVREITAAYATLRNPAKRAEYDARRDAREDSWTVEEALQQPPPMRAVGIGAMLFALAAIGAVWAWPRSAGEQRNIPPARQVDPPAPRPADHPVELPPKSDRPSEIDQQADVRPSPVAPQAPPPEVRTIAPQPPSAPVADAAAAVASPVRHRVTPPLQTRARRVRVEAKPTTAAAKAAAKDDRVATLERMSAGFFSQSMVHATDAKKALLLAARDRSAAERKACRSQSCVADIYVRQIRQTGAIMESKPPAE